MLTGLGLETFLGDGRTIEVVTDPMQFRRTMEYQALANVDPLVPGTFWGKDFLLADVDNSGPVSIDIPPGTYTGAQLADVAEVALRDAFGDDKKVQLTAGVDSTFTIDFKKSSGDGKSTGLPAPITVDLHADSIVTATPEDGMKMDTFLSHAQRLMTNQLNSYIQDPADADGVDPVKVANIGAEGKLFKKVIGGTAIAAIPPVKSDVISLAHKNTAANGANAVTRYLAYSNVGNNPEIKAYDNIFTQDGNGIGDHADGTVNALAVDADGYLTVKINGVTTGDMEVLRFQQPDSAGNAEGYVALFGHNEIAIKKREEVTANGDTDTLYTLDFIVPGGQNTLTNIGAQDPIRILAKPSDHIEAYFEDTAGLVEGVKDVFYSNKIVVREIGDSAKRTAAQDTDTAFATFTSLNGSNVTNFYGLGSPVTTMDWVDERDPSLKIGYDETNQRLTFDGVNGKLGKGTGVGFDTFTVYSKKLDAGKNGLGIPALGESPEVSLKTDNLLLGDSFVNDGPEIRVNNKRYGMEVEFDTVNNVFNVKSGSTGEALAGGSVVGIDLAQNASSVAVGRYNLTLTGTVDQTDTADYEANKIGKGSNQIMGFPRAGIEGYRPPTGLVSKPAVVVGLEGLMDMSQTFTVTALANENVFNVVVGGVSASIAIPEGNYKGDTLATALEERINSMKNPISGQSVGGVDVKYDAIANNLTFTTSTTGEGNTIAINGALKFGLKDVPLGLGTTTTVRQPVQATDELGRPLYISPQGAIVANNQDFADNMVENFYPLYLDEGELTFDRDGQIVSPITDVKYTGNLTELTLDFSTATQLDQPFSAREVTQDGFSAGRLSNLEIDNYGNVRAGYSNGQNVTLGKIMLASFASESGLKQIGNSTFISTAASGDPELGEGAEDGFGQILSGSIERSNVDITEELVNLITSQRNYQAAAKAIETSSSMTQTIINIRS
jgi:flagellar hook protein FlgE